MDKNIIIRLATEGDAEELLQIYAPYVRETAISFEYEVPSAAEFSRRIKDILRVYPYIIALEDSRAVGYAYASEFKGRAAYNWSVETSVYLKGNLKGRGLGKMLYLALEDILRKQNIINLNACISYTADEDQYLDNTSVFFHERLGYSKVAHFTKCGYKFGRWYDMIWMEKLLCEHPEKPKPIIPVSELYSSGSIV